MKLYSKLKKTFIGINFIHSMRFFVEWKKKLYKSIYNYTHNQNSIFYTHKSKFSDKMNFFIMYNFANGCKYIL